MIQHYMMALPCSHEAIQSLTELSAGVYRTIKWVQLLPNRKSTKEVRVKRLLTLLIVSLVMLGLVVAPALAAPADELNALAKYFPAETQFFVSFRTDDRYIATLDNLAQRIANSIPDATLPGRFADMLDEGVKALLGKGTFQSEVRSWLGDVASIGLFSFEAMMPRSGSSDSQPPHFLFAATVKDQKAAENFWTAALEKTNSRGYKSSTQGGFTVYTPDKGTQGIVAIGSDVMFVSMYQEDIPFSDQSSPLSDSATFNDSIALLPEPDYNIVMYANLGEFLKSMMDMQAGMMDSAGMGGMFESLKGLYQNFPPEVIGFTVLDERSLTIDIALPYGNLLQAMQDTGFPVAMPQPVDPAFAARIPGGIPLVIHSTDLGVSIGGFLQSLRMQSEMMAGSGASAQDIEKGLNQAKFFIQGLTGLDLEKDIIPALKGDYALYMGLSPALSDVQNQSDLMKQLPVEFAFMTEIGDAKVTAGLLQGIKMALSSAKEVKVKDEKIAGADAIVINVVGAGMPFPVEFVVSGNNGLFVFGTRRAVQTALRGDGGLPADPSFQEAGQYLVSSPSAVAYLASAGLRPIAKLIELTGSRRDARQFGALLDLLSSASISSTMQGNNAYARMVWTLPQ